jgi:hypothetical protein
VSGTTNPLWAGLDPNALTWTGATQPLPRPAGNPLASIVMGNPVETQYLPMGPFAGQSVGMPAAGGFDPVVAMPPGGVPTMGSDVAQARAQMDFGAPLAASMVMGMTGDAPGGKPAVPGFTAYHGSPHDFPPTANNPLGEFNDANIGTGEGAQAYGRGHYVADAESTGKSYRDALSTWDNKVGQRVTETTGISDLSPAHLTAVQQIAMNTSLPVADAAKQLAARVPNLRGFDDPNMMAPKPTLEKLVTAIRGDTNPGHMYEVHVAADPARFLDWGKPLSEQHPMVQQALAPMGFTPNANGPGASVPMRGPIQYPEPTGAQIYHRLSGGDFGGKQEAAAQALQQAGIPGVRYLDAGSRGAGEGSRNTVVFDPSIMSIMRKYAIPAAMLSGTGHGLALGSGGDTTDTGNAPQQ